MLRATHVSLFLFASIISVSAAFAQTGSPTLQRHANKDGRFEALMPANTRSVMVPGKQLTDSYYQARGKTSGTEFRLKVQVISVIDVEGALKNQMTESYADLAQQALEKSFGKAATSKAVKQHGMEGRDFVHRISAEKTPNGQEIVFNQRVMFDGKRLYIATHLGIPDDATLKLGSKFLDSVQPLKTRYQRP